MEDRKQLMDSGLMSAIGESIVQYVVENDAKISKEIQTSIKSALLKEFRLVKKIEVVLPNAPPKEIEGVAHEKFGLILSLVTNNIPVFLVGNAGTGKNHICKMASDALGLRFLFSNAVTDEYKITGFLDANGNYHETPFYDAFVNGGLFFIDELDASIPEILVILNAAIENRYFPFPTGIKNAHPDFRVIAAGNTYGSGSDEKYVGRFALDCATLDRFAHVEVTYDPAIEELLSEGDTEILNFVRAIRSGVNKAGVRTVITYRAITTLAKMKGCIAAKDIVRIAITKGLCRDDLELIKKNIPSRNGCGEYMDMFDEIVAEMKDVESR